jgi:phytoene desaturase
MSRRVVVIGAGIGGLAAAACLAREGCDVTLLEARDAVGGLASSERHDGLSFDAGPYVLLDRPGLAHAFQALQLDIDSLGLQRIDDLLEIARDDAPTLRLRADLQATADGLDATWPGCGQRWMRFVAAMSRRRERLMPSLLAPRPGLRSMLRGGAWRDVGFLLGSLEDGVRPFGLPRAVEDAVFIWTHVAGQRPDEAPAPLAFVPALVHGPGAWLPRGGIGRVATCLADAAIAAGGRIVTGCGVDAIRFEGRRVVGVRTSAGDDIAADAVVSNAGALATSEVLAPQLAASHRALSRMPLQSPGTCAYLAVRGVRPGPYLRFRLTAREGSPSRLLVLPSIVDASLSREGWSPARLIVPIAHADAERLGADGQRQFADALLAETWWREHVDDARVLAIRRPVDWASDFHLHRGAMNPVMTARLMRAGRVPHRSRQARGLYFAGSSTHPGQWVSFCALSGLHAAAAVLEDLA